MGTLAHILKDWRKHQPEKVFKDAAEVSFNINVMFWHRNNKTYYKDGRFEYASIGIIDDTDFIKQGNNNQFIFNIKGVNMDDIVVGLDRDFDFLKPNEHLCSLANAEKVRDYNQDLIARFMYEYLKLNPDEYLWLEGEYVYCWDDLKKLNHEQIKKGWFFENPKKF